MERVVRDVVAVFQTGRFVAGVIQMAGDRQVEPVFYIAADTGTDRTCQCFVCIYRLRYGSWR